MEWKPIETAPKDGTYFLCSGYDYGLKYRNRHYAVCQYNEMTNEYSDEDSEVYEYLTHWTELTKPPED